MSFCFKVGYFRSGFVWKWLVPLNPMVLLIITPKKMAISLEIYPIFRQTHMGDFVDGRVWQGMAGYGRVWAQKLGRLLRISWHSGFETTMAEHGIFVWDITERYRKEGQIYDEACTHATCASNLSRLCAWSQDAPWLHTLVSGHRSLVMSPFFTSPNH